MMQFKILQKSCPHCGMKMQSKVDDNDFLPQSISLFKTVACDICTGFKNEASKVAELKAEAWSVLNRLQLRLTNIQSAERAGSQAPNLHANKANRVRQIGEAREVIKSLDEREQNILNRRNHHEQELKAL